MRILPIVAVSAALAASSAHAQSPPRTFVPEVAFAGRSEGQGTMHFIFGRTKPYRVENVGAVLPDGTFRLDQRISMEGEAPRSRTWIMTRVGEGRYAFTLSEAVGPGEAHAEGNSLELSYPAKRGGIGVQQFLSIDGEGAIANEGRICFLGIPIGWLRETIRR